MGLFGGKKKVYVSSQVYNLAGDEADRQNFLKTAVVGAVFSDQDITDTLQTSYFGGPGMRLRQYPKWANQASSGYNDYFKQISGSIAGGNSINNGVLAGYLPHNAGEVVNIQTSDTGLSDYSWWAEQWILAHDPSRLNEEWSADYANGNIIITWPDGSMTAFVPDNFVNLAKYLYAAYTTSTGLKADPIVPGDTISLGSNGAFPTTVGWTQDYFSSTPMPVTLNTVTDIVVSYSDGRPNETSSSTSGTPSSYTETHGVYERTDYVGTDSTDQSTVSKSTRKIMYQDQYGSVINDASSTTTTTETIEDGVTKTTKTTTTPQKVLLARSYRVDTQALVTSEVSKLKIYIYRYQTGNAALDAMFAPLSNFGEFMPFIPFRLDNVEVDATTFPEAYPLAKKAFKKAIKGDYDAVSESILNNESIKDIDYTYAVFGVSLNVIEPACRKYIFKFFELLLESVTGGSAAYDQFQVDYQKAYDSNIAYQAWIDGQHDQTSPLHGTPAPALVAYPALPTQSVSITAPDNPVMNIDFMISWTAIGTDSGSGLRPGHTKGELWWEENDAHTYDVVISNGAGGTGYELLVDHITLYWQVDSNNWKSITISGLQHTNTIYKGKSVDITGSEAINDSEESGFIIPIHTGLYNSISIVDATQMSTACAFLVFNCYKVVKQKWYTTSIFKIIVIIIAIIIAVVSWGSGTPISSALIAAEVAAGTALGLSLVASLIIAVVVNAIAAMILSKLLSTIATSIFGPKLGPLIGALVTVVAIAVGGSVASGGSMAEGFSSLTSASNLMALTSAVGTGIQGYIAAEIQEVADKTQGVISDYNKQQKAIQDKYLDTFGSDSQGVIDPMMFTNSTAYGNFDNYTYESVSSFLGRTLMNGTDIAQMSLKLIENFPALTTSTDLSNDDF